MFVIIKLQKRTNVLREVKFMETRFVLLTIFEIAVVAFITYGLFNEAKFAETERKVFRFIKRYVRAFINGTDVSRGRG